MLNLSKAACIQILRKASKLNEGALLRLDPKRLGLTRNDVETAVLFLIERACFIRYQRESDGYYTVGGLSLQGKLRLDQLTTG